MQCSVGYECVPPGFDVVKEECVNHVHKRMVKAFLTLTKKMHLEGTGFGRLTQGKAPQFQNYYRGAVINNIGDVDKMRDTIWATLYHCMSTDENPHHKCPAGSKSWCFYQQAIANEKKATIACNISRSSTGRECGQCYGPCVWENEWYKLIR